MFGLFNRAPVNIILRGIKNGSLEVVQRHMADEKEWVCHAFTITRKMPDGDVVIRIERRVEAYIHFVSTSDVRYTTPEWMTFSEANKIFNACIDRHNTQTNNTDAARQKQARRTLAEQLTREIPNV